MEVGRRFIDCAKQIAAAYGDHAVSVPMKGGLLKLRWTDVYVDGVEIRAFPTSLLPTQPAARLEKLVMLWERSPRGAHNRVSPLNFLDWSEQQQAFASVAAIAGGARTLTGSGGEAERIPGQAGHQAGAKHVSGRGPVRHGEQHDRAAIGGRAHVRGGLSGRARPRRRWRRPPAAGRRSSPSRWRPPRTAAVAGPAVPAWSPAG